MASLDSGVTLYPYKCEYCGYTITYDKPQPEYALGFVCGQCQADASALIEAKHEQSSE